MMNQGLLAEETPFDDICRGAMEHYEKLAKEACSWMNTVPKAIEFYRRHGPELQEPTDDERKEMLEWLEGQRGGYWCNRKYIEGGNKPMVDAIRALIMGEKRTVTQERIENLEGEIISEILFQANSSKDEIHPGIKITSLIEKMLAELGIGIEEK